MIDNLLQTVDEYVNLVGGFLWTYIIIAVLILLGVFFTVKTNFVQVRYFFEMFRVLRHGITGHKTKSALSKPSVLVQHLV